MRANECDIGRSVGSGRSARQGGKRRLNWRARQNWAFTPAMIAPVSCRAWHRLVFWLLLGALTRLGAQVTETPSTMAPGRFLLRVDAITIGVDRDHSSPKTYTALGLASALLSTGVTRDLDVQFGLQFFLRQTYQYQGASRTSSGRGDTTIRAKYTFWRDPARGAAMAVIPYVKLPSNTGGVGNNHTEGGLIVPWAMSFGRGTSLGAMGQWDVRRNLANTRYDSRWLASGYAKQHLFGGLAAYAEATFSVSSASASTFVGGLGGGVTYDISKSLQLDYNLSRGLGNRATDWTNLLRVNWSF
jgi:hypothetical protein